MDAHTFEQIVTFGFPLLGKLDERACVAAFSKRPGGMSRQEAEDRERGSSANARWSGTGTLSRGRWAPANDRYGAVDK